MSERKVLNKYYPPDYDPSLIPRLKRAKDRQYVIRVMAPFNMRCKTCGNYIYKGTKFNARMETVQDKNYLGLRIYRFYIKCTKCVAEITFLTDPENYDYSIEHGATRNFEAEKLVDEERKREEAKRLEDEANPMKMLELRTRDSKREMEMVEALDELRELNERHAALDFEEMLKERQESEEERIAREKREEDEEVMKIFNKTAIRRIQDDNDSDDEDAGHSSSSKSYAQKRSLAPSDILFTDGDNGTSIKFSAKSSKLDNKTKHKTSAAMLGIIRKPRPATAKPSSTTQVTEQHITVEKRTSADEATTAAVAGTSTGVGDGIAQEKKPVAAGGLSLLGCYDTSSSSDDGGVSN